MRSRRVSTAVLVGALGAMMGGCQQGGPQWETSGEAEHDQVEVGVARQALAESISPFPGAGDFADSSDMNDWSGSCTRSTSQAHSGSYALRCGGGQSSTLTVDASGYTGINVSYYRTGSSLESGEDFTIEYSVDGTAWTNLETAGDDSGFVSRSFALNTDADNASALQLRFSTDASSSTYDAAYLDTLDITGEPNSTCTPDCTNKSCGADDGCGGSCGTDADNDGYCADLGVLDCNDTDSSINPGKTEVCDNNKDDDCSDGDAVCEVLCGGPHTDTIQGHMDAGRVEATTTTSFWSSTTTYTAVGSGESVTADGETLYEDGVGYFTHTDCGVGDGTDPYCGDGTCDSGAGEDCSNCSDCGSCNSVDDPVQVGPYDACYYESGLDESGFINARMYYPCPSGSAPSGPVISGTHPATTLSGGSTNTSADMFWLGKHTASHGFITLVMRPGNNGLFDNNSEWRDAHKDAYNELLEENGNGSPVSGAIDGNKIGIMGFSKGGGGTLMAAEELQLGGATVAAVIGLAPWQDSTIDAGDITAPTMILVGSNDGLAHASSHGYPMYQKLTCSPRLYGQFTDFEHGAWYSSADQTQKNHAFHYIISWMKVHMAGETAYDTYYAGADHQSSWFDSFILE